MKKKLNLFVLWFPEIGNREQESITPSKRSDDNTNRYRHLQQCAEVDAAKESIV